MSNQPRSSRWYRIAPSVLISAAINAVIIFALSIVVTSPKKDFVEYPVNYYVPVKIAEKPKVEQQPIIKKIKPVINKTKIVKKTQPAKEKITAVKPVKTIIIPVKNIVIAKAITPAPIKPTRDNTENTKPNPAAVAKNNPAAGNNNALPDNNAGGSGRNNSLANDTPRNSPGNNGGTSRPDRIGPGNLSVRPGPGNGDDNPGDGEPTFGSPLTPSFGPSGQGSGKEPGDGGGTNGSGNGNGNGIGPGKYRGGAGDGPGNGGWGGDGSGEPRNLGMGGTGEKPGNNAKTGGSGTPGIKLNPESGTPGYSRKARAIKLTAPEYPSVARRRGQEGDVYVRVDLSEEGKPIGKPVVVISSGVYLLDQSAIDYVQNTDFIQYVPAIKGGKPARDSVVVQVIFKLTDDGKF